MIDPVAKYIVKALVPAVAAVKGRVERAHFADVPNPTYPLITFAREMPGLANHVVPLQDYRLLFGFQSDKSKDEAWALYESAEPLLDVQATVDGAQIYLRPATSPFEDTDTTGKTVYRVLVLYEARVIS